MHSITTNTLRQLTVVGLLLMSTNLLAQNSGVTRTPVIQADSSIPGKEDYIFRIDVAGGGKVDWHTHPGDEISYVMHGELELLLANQAPRKIKPGEGFVIPAGVVHSAKNHGKDPVKLVGVYVVEKGQPVASPASPPAP
ncbi:cupin domain-containing protein [Undibacterium sp. TC4M20W]|uniref:cupin domain-containing protein n=1 Tax=Undibacterium sp. TC4M20W TaxID=3413052 RepID=UPI003BEFDC7E